MHPVRRQPVPRRVRRRRWRGSVGSRVTASATGTRYSCRVRRTVGQAGAQRIVGHIRVLPCRRGHGAQRAPRLTDGLVHLGHPVGEVAVIERLAIERRHGRQRRHGDRILPGSSRTPPAYTKAHCHSVGHGTVTGRTQRERCAASSACISTRARGVRVSGTTGEWFFQTEAEHRRVAEIAAEELMTASARVRSPSPCRPCRCAHSGSAPRPHGRRSPTFFSASRSVTRGTGTRWLRRK